MSVELQPGLCGRPCRTISSSSMASHNRHECRSPDRPRKSRNVRGQAFRSSLSALGLCHNSDHSRHSNRRAETSHRTAFPGRRDGLRGTLNAIRLKSYQDSTRTPRCVRRSQGDFKRPGPHFEVGLPGDFTITLRTGVCRMLWIAGGCVIPLDIRYVLARLQFWRSQPAILQTLTVTH